MSSFSEDDAFEAAVPLSQRAVAARPAPYLDDLNPAQREAVETLDGPVLMLAGAGTGKTKALTTRITHLLLTGRARPNEILAVTFTNKAAREMKDRVSRLLGQPAEGMPWLGTFHAISAKLLGRHAGVPYWTCLSRPDTSAKTNGRDERRHLFSMNAWRLEQAQTALARLGYLSEPFEEDLGPKTKAAISRFQRRARWPASP